MFLFNDKAPKKIKFNDKSVKTLIYNGIVVWTEKILKAISGISPLTLGSCADNQSIVNYTMYGNSVQNETPTPANPIEIESVGIRSSNLLPYPYKAKTSTVNGVTFTMNNDGSILINGTAKAATTVYLHQDTKNLLPGIKSGDTIAVSKFSDDEEQRGLVYFICNYYNEAGSMKQGAQATTAINGYATVTDEWKGMAAYLHIPNGNTINNLLLKLKIGIGKPATDWEPFGYRIPVVARGKNLIDYRNFVSRNQSTMPLTINDDGSLDYTGTYYIKVPLSHLQSGKTYAFRMTYTFDGELVEVGKIFGTCQFRYTDGSYIAARYGQGIQTDPTKELLELHCYFKSGYQQTFTAKIWDIQLEEASVSTEYEPYKEPITTDIYLNKPLMGISKAFDYIDFENQKVVRKIGNYLLGISAMREITHDTLISFYYLVPDKTRNCDSTKVEVLSPSLLGIPRNKNINLYNTPAISGNVTDNAVFAYLYREDVGDNTHAAIQNYLETNPITIYYELATPIEESIDLPQLPNYEGTTVLEVNTIAKPNMDVSYYTQGG